MSPQTREALQVCEPYLQGKDHQLLGVERVKRSGLGNLAGRLDAGQPGLALPFTSAEQFNASNKVSRTATLLLIRESQDTIVLCSVDICSPRVARFKRVRPPGLSERWIVEEPGRWSEQICLLR